MRNPDTYTTTAGVEISEWDDNIGDNIISKLGQTEYDLSNRQRIHMACKLQMRSIKFLIWLQRRAKSQEAKTAWNEFDNNYKNNTCNII